MSHPRILAVLLLAFLTSSILLSGVERAHPRIIPAPREVEWLDGALKISSATRIVLGEGCTSDDEFAAQRINEALGELGKERLRIVREADVRRVTANVIYLGTPRSAFAVRSGIARTSLTPEMKDEGYVLRISADAAVVVGATPAGRFYGVMSLVQLLMREKRSVLLPAVAVRDWPLQSIRGISDDISRGQVSTLENFRRIIRFLARYKLNTYTLYLEDMFAFRSYPTIGRGRGALTAQEVKDLDAYAKRYHVDLVPTFETLGHWENILIKPEFSRYAEFPGAHTLNVSDEEVYRMLDRMIGELASAFSSPWFNMAADESWDVGLGANKARVAASDLATVHAEHYNRLFAILKKYNKRPMMYGDVILNNPTILDKIPRDVMIVDWHYGAADQYPSPAVFEKAGMPFVVCPAVWNFTGPFPNYLNTFVNIRNLVRDGYRHGSRGVITSNWNDFGGEELRELNLLGYAWTAECAWHPLDADAESFTEAFFRDFTGAEGSAFAARTAYLILTQPLTLVAWNDLWRHPMLPIRQTLPLVWREEGYRAQRAIVDDLLDNGRREATRNREHWNYLRFVADLEQWYGEKLRAGEWVRTVTEHADSTTPHAIADSVRIVCDSVVRSLEDLRASFEKLWRTTNRREGLDLLLARYDRQIAYWKEKTAQVDSGAWWVDPVIPSRWICHPLGNPWTKDSALTQVPMARFTKTIVVQGDVLKAPLQLIGDTEATVWVNGDSVGTVFARRSLSLIVEQERVKMWDVARFLRRGENIITVDARSYAPRGSGGFNLYAEIHDPVGRVDVVVSDSTWHVIDLGVTEQGGTDAGAVRKELQAREYAYPFTVMRPDLAHGRLSWIER